MKRKCITTKKAAALPQTEKTNNRPKARIAKKPFLQEWLFNYLKKYYIHKHLLTFGFFYQLSITQLSARSQGTSGGYDIRSSSTVTVEFNSVAKSHDYVFMYKYGSLNYVRYGVKTQHTDTFRFDAKKLEAIVYRTAFPKTSKLQMDFIHSLLKGEPNMFLQSISANHDTLTTTVAVYTADTSDFTEQGGNLKGASFVIRVLGDRLLSVDNYTAVDTALVRATNKKYAISFMYAPSFPAFVVLPVIEDNADAASETLVRVSKSLPLRFLSWENYRLPDKNVKEHLGYDHLLPINDEDFFIFFTSTSLYQFSSQKSFDLSAAFNLKDTSKLQGTYPYRWQVHDISDMGGNSVSVLVRHGSDLRRMDFRLEGSKAVLEKTVLVASRYPNSDQGFPTVLVGGKCISYSAGTGNFNLISGH